MNKFTPLSVPNFEENKFGNMTYMENLMNIAEDEIYNVTETIKNLKDY